jgi:hypothetical protein
MIPHHVYYQVAGLGRLWGCLMLHALWPSRGALSLQPSAAPVPLKRKRSHDPAACAGLPQRPYCAACAHAASPSTPPPLRRPDPMPLTTRRPRVMATSRHFCPHAGCDYRG